jgi:hypothetical protein
MTEEINQSYNRNNALDSKTRAKNNCANFLADFGIKYLPFILATTQRLIQIQSSGLRLDFRFRSAWLRQSSWEYPLS